MAVNGSPKADCSLEDEALSSLPPVIINNPRQRIVTDEVPISTSAIKLCEKTRLDPHVPLVYYPPAKLLEPLPVHPLVISWSPDYLCFQLGEDPIVATLTVWNCCPRPIYMHCCGLWNDTARLGASWCCHPRTRFWLAPGLRVDIIIRATPHLSTPPIPSAISAMQIATQHMRDHVTGYFRVPIRVKFLKYAPPCLGEVE